MAAGEPGGFGDPRHLGLGSAGLPWDLEESRAWLLCPPAGWPSLWCLWVSGSSGAKPECHHPGSPSSCDPRGFAGTEFTPNFKDSAGKRKTQHTSLVSVVMITCLNNTLDMFCPVKRFSRITFIKCPPLSAERQVACAWHCPPKVLPALKAEDAPDFSWCYPARQPTGGLDLGDWE